jgi:hypothetical protein
LNRHVRKLTIFTLPNSSYVCLTHLFLLVIVNLVMES